MVLRIAKDILEPFCHSLAPQADQTITTTCQVIVPQASLWTQLGPYIAFAGALFAFFGGLGELIEAKDKNAGTPLRIGQRVSAWSKIGLGVATIIIVAAMYFTEASVATDINDELAMRYLGIVTSATLPLLIVVSILLSLNARRQRKRSLQTIRKSQRGNSRPQLRRATTLVMAFALGAAAKSTRRSPRRPH